ncbi:MAG: hypothetical protein IKY94_04625, partial [Lachnospiraceae bacterium]|nr:hypothetical protein [Lachnospiraceae bacterium]
VSHQTTLDIPTDSTTLIYETACHLFKELWNGTPIRLLGIRTSKLCHHSEPIQLSLFDMMDPNSVNVNTTKHKISDSNIFPANTTTALYRKEKQENLDKALDKIKNKYGKDAVIRGSLLKEDKKK